MPDFLPTPQLPTGLADQVLRLAAERAQYNPWAAAAQAAGQVGQGVAAKRQRTQQLALEHPTLTPEQAQAMGLPANVGGQTVQTPNGPVTVGQTKPMSQVFPGGVPMSLVEQISRQKEQEAIAKQTTERMLQVQGLKDTSGHVQISQDMIDKNPDLKKKGITPGMYPSSFATALLKPPSASSDQNLTPQEMQALEGAARRSQNPLPVSLISFRGPRAKIIAQSLIKDPNWSPTAGEAGLAGAKAGASASARFDESGPGQMVARVANSAMEQLDNLQKASDNFPRSDVRLLNTPIMKLDEQTMPEAAEWKVALNTARMEYATALNRGNSPGLENIAEATKAIPDNITMKQLPSVIKQLRIGLTNTVKGMTTRVPPNGSAKPSAKPKAGAAPDYTDLSDDELLKQLGQ